MANFSVISLINGGDPVSAPRVYSLSTADTQATVFTAGYLNSYTNLFKAGDIVFITTDLSTTATTYQCYVRVSGGNISLIKGVTSGSNISATPYHIGRAGGAGGSATVTVSILGMVSQDIVLLNLISSETSGAYVLNVNPGSGSFVVTFNADPGATVFGYTCYHTT